MPTKIEPIQAFLSHIDMGNVLGCWLWMAHCKSNGYGEMYVNRKPVYPHRWIYEYLNGEIPKGQHIHHVCNNPRCVNPSHLKNLTVSEHRKLTRPYKQTNHQYRTHCYRGHEFTTENTVNTSKGRFCKICLRARWRRRYYKRKIINAVREFLSLGAKK